MLLRFRTMKAISLPHFSVGDAQFRFICYSKTSGKFRLSYNIQVGDDELLFLGADLINSTLHNNLHTKYWNKGLCVKIHLKDAIIKGIPNSTSLWFYTIEGVFQYTFTHLDLIQQKHIITSLLTYWMRLKTNSNLPRKMDVPVDLIEDELSADGEKDSKNESFAVEDVSAARETHIIFHLSYVLEPKTELLTEASRTENSLTEDVLFVDKQPQNELNDIDATLNKIASTMETVEHEQRQGLLSALRITCLYFESQMPHGPDNFFPFNVLETYLSIASPMNGFTASEVGAFAANRHDVMLYVVSSWLGKEFLRMKRRVQDEIAAFKQQYLHRFDQLPKPKAIVQELFPACMVELLERWLGVGNEQISQEHSYFRNSIKNSGKRIHPYPIIQLILEFVNETLILGTSHALYTQLASMPE